MVSFCIKVLYLSTEISQNAKIFYLDHWGCRCSIIPLWESSLKDTIAGDPQNRILTSEMAQRLPALDPQWAFNPGDIPKTKLAEFLKTRLTLFIQYPDLAEHACRDALRELKDFRP